MTGTTASLNVSVALPSAALPSFLTVGASVAAPVKVGVTVPGAAPSLATFVDLMIGKVVAPKPKPPGGTLQDSAVPGKGLPDGDAERETRDTLAWLFAPVPVEPIAMVAPQVDLPVGVAIGDVAADTTAPLVPTLPTGPNPIVVGPVAPEPAPIVAADLTAALPLKTAPAPVLLTDIIAPIAPDVPAPIPVPVAFIQPDVAVTLSPVIGIQAPAIPDPAPLPVAPALPLIAVDLPPVAQPLVEPMIVPVKVQPALPTDPNVSVELRIRPIAVATPQPAVVAPTPAPIVQPMQAVIAQIVAGGAAQPALFALAAGRERSADDDARPSLSAASTAALLLQPTDAAALIAKPGGAQGQALDMGRQDWPQKMIDRIETLRDNADSTDTSIRLKPDALGGIQVAVRSHGDGAVSVRFTADHPTTRMLLADAQPQLQAAAEARGIKLTGTSVDLSGSGGQPERGQPRFEAKPNTNNHLAASGENDAVTDGRVA